MEDLAIRAPDRLQAPRRLAWLAAVIALLLPAAATAGAPGLQIVAQKPAVEPGVDRFVLHSALAGRDFLVDVGPPGKPLAAGEKAPAIYALDSGYGVARPIARMMGGIGGMQPAFTVSVGYVSGGAEARLKDLLYDPVTRDGKTMGGGGAAFEGFLLDELKPFIEARYAVDPARSVLFGHSLGGLFAANVLVNHPRAFNGFLIASPSVWADPGIVERLKGVADQGGGRRVFVGVGGAEGAGMIGPAQAVAAALSPGFLVQGRTYAGESHMTYYPQLVATAFPWLLPPTPPAPKPAASPPAP